jgi:hypothetical protein
VAEIAMRSAVVLEDIAALTLARAAAVVLRAWDREVEALAAERLVEPEVVVVDAVKGSDVRRVSRNGIKISKQI